MTIRIDWTPEKKEAVIQAIEEWINEYRAFSGEHIMQDDDCQIYAPVLLSELVDDIIEPEYEYDDND